MDTLPIAGILPIVDKTPPPGPGQLIQTAEILIIAGLLTGQQGVQGVVEIVVPLGVQGESA